MTGSLEAGRATFIRNWSMMENREVELKLKTDPDGIDVLAHAARRRIDSHGLRRSPSKPLCGNSGQARPISSDSLFRSMADRAFPIGTRPPSI
jgi:hypothetical protein